eukprot:CCRYP_019802-RA/>CCRYP_019802-RA protein AED:0.36 eAED:0.32 QI:0/0/0/1/0/0/2/0/220
MWFFYGASNVQKAGAIIEQRYPRISSLCAAEHTTSLFFDNLFKTIRIYSSLSNFCKKLRNVFGSVIHDPASTFKSHSKKHNRGIHIGFIIPSDCRMAGQLIAMLRLLHLKEALQATVTSPEFIALGAFLDVARVVMTDEFWALQFLMYRATCPQMRILRLADQKVSATDKLAYFIYQADRLTPKFLIEAEQHILLLSEGIMEIIDCTDDIASEEFDERDD